MVFCIIDPRAEADESVLLKLFWAYLLRRPYLCVKDFCKHVGDLLGASVMIRKHDQERLHCHVFPFYPLYSLHFAVMKWIATPWNKSSATTMQESNRLHKKYETRPQSA